MQILVLNGSPKGERSNTLRLTRAFLEGTGWPQAERIDVANADIQACSGCFACWNQTPGRCVLQDDMQDLLAKILAADVLVWSFPLYYYSVPGSLKNFIDRQLPLSLPFMAGEKAENGGHPPRYNTNGQRHLVFSTCGFWTPEGNYEAVRAMFDHFVGRSRYTAIFCGQGELFRVPEVRARTDAYLGLVRRAGAEYAAGGIQAQTHAALAEPLYPREAFERMADASWGISRVTQAPAATDDSLFFTEQMAALYRPDGTERILEMRYTDIEKTYQLVLTKQGAKVVTDKFRPCTTRIETPYAVWRSIARGEISGQTALFQRLYTVSGDFGLLLKWDELFGAQTPVTHTNQASVRNANLLLLLAPWIVLWTAVPLHSVAGGVLGICVAALLPLLWMVFRPVVYERISFPVVSALSLAAVLGAQARVVVSVSHLLFGLLWLVGTRPAVPLTAHYSAAGYGGEKALSNPLFLRTNRILTAAWGGLYLVMPVWTYMLMGTGISTYVDYLNSALPALLGLFTAWFQKWYPAHYARGRVRT